VRASPDRRRHRLPGRTAASMPTARPSPPSPAPHDDGGVPVGRPGPAAAGRAARRRRRLPGRHAGRRGGRASWPDEAGAAHHRRVTGDTLRADGARITVLVLVAPRWPAPRRAASSTTPTTPTATGVAPSPAPRRAAPGDRAAGGRGPGDPELLTLRPRAALASATLVLETGGADLAAAFRPDRDGRAGDDRLPDDVARRLATVPVRRPGGAALPGRPWLHPDHAAESAALRSLGVPVESIPAPRRAVGPPPPPASPPTTAPSRSPSPSPPRTTSAADRPHPHPGHRSRRPCTTLRSLLGPRRPDVPASSSWVSRSRRPRRGGVAAIRTRRRAEFASRRADVVAAGRPRSNCRGAGVGRSSRRARRDADSGWVQP